jgi:hypothetical protein
MNCLLARVIRLLARFARLHDSLARSIYSLNLLALHTRFSGAEGGAPSLASTFTVKGEGGYCISIIPVFIFIFGDWASTKRGGGLIFGEKKGILRGKSRKRQ